MQQIQPVSEDWPITANEHKAAEQYLGQDCQHGQRNCSLCLAVLCRMMTVQGYDLGKGKTGIPVASMQRLGDVGINLFACQLVAESLLKHPKPEEVEFFLPIDRSDCADWVGVRFILEPIKTAEEA